MCHPIVIYLTYIDDLSGLKVVSASLRPTTDLKSNRFERPEQRYPGAALRCAALAMKFRASEQKSEQQSRGNDGAGRKHASSSASA
jgi:hypothetical protein